MAIETRRGVLRRIAFGLGVVACGRAIGQPAERAVYAAIETSARTGLSAAAFFAAGGARTGRVALDFRAHGMAEDADRLVVFPRRPGDRFALVDKRTLELRGVVAAPRGRHFFGHGAFSADGAHLLVTENDVERFAGAIGVYETRPTLRRTGQIALPGPGPHEIVRDPGRDIFRVAVGGLQTHPDYGRTPLNLGDFRSQVVTLDFRSGDQRPMGFWAGSEGVSLRHLARDGRGRLFVGGQIADETRAGAGAHVVWHVDGDDVRAVDDRGRLGGYVSSVAAHGSEAVLTSKETGAVLRFDGHDELGESRLAGASGVAVGPALHAVSGFGRLRLNGAEVRARAAHEFDNHAIALPG